MNTEELIAAAEGLVKELQGRINGGGMDLQEAEAKILEMVNWIGDAMVQEVVTGLDEPTSANRITVGGEVAVFERVRNLRFINRFGEEVVTTMRLNTSLITAICCLPHCATATSDADPRCCGKARCCR